MNAGASHDASVVLVGGPDSGKSNYIFRLWLAITAGKGRITAAGLPDHLEYLQEGSQSLLSGEFAQRTQHDVVSENVIPIKYEIAGASREGGLVVPDCMGERWIGIFKNREWGPEWEQHVSETSGFLVFVRPTSEQIINPLDWIQCEKIFGQPLPEMENSDVSMPTQVVITDWLQFIGKAFMDRVGGGYRPRVGVMVTAWDLVPNDRQVEGPSAYVAKELPLLAQFMTTNTDSMDFATFGVSIAGGDFKNEPGFKDKSLAQTDPLSGGFVMHELGGMPAKDSDLTLPVAWAMGARVLVGGR